MNSTNILKYFPCETMLSATVCEFPIEKTLSVRWTKVSQSLVKEIMSKRDFKFHGSVSVLYGDNIGTYGWGSIRLKYRPLPVLLKEILLYLKFFEYTKWLRLSYALCNVYRHIGDKQPFHQDEDDDGDLTHVIIVHFSDKPRKLTCKSKDGKIKYLNLRPGRFYILTPVFNLIYKHQHINRDGVLSHSITLRSNHTNCKIGSL